MRNKKLYSVFHSLFGSYTVRLTGEQIPSFVHRLAADGFLFWSFCKTQDAWELHTALSGAELLLRRASDAGIGAEIVGEHGLPFVIAKYKKRPGLLLGAILGLVLLFYGELFVWKVSVHGNTVLSEQEIIRALERYGIGVGSYIPDIPVLDVQNEFLLEYRELSSIAVNIRGTHIEIEVLERTHAPEPVDRTGYCNIIAAEDGIIQTIEVADGSAMVKPGDVVVAGQLLVSAYTVDGKCLYYPHHARAKIKAQVETEYSAVIPLERSAKHFTGRKSKKISFCVLGKRFNLFRSEYSPFECFETIVTEKPLKLFGLIETPLVRTTVVYREYRDSPVSLSRAQATQNAELALQLWLSLQTDEVSESAYTVTYDEIQNACILNASVVLLKDICSDSPLQPGEAPPEALKPPTVQPH